MVSTRAPKSRFFDKGERVLCYEPDPTKAKVLYDSKVLGTYETKDRRGRKLLQYKIHFQGWSSSWDRKVNADFVLKDTEENRQLQKDLAEKAQLQLGAYLYRRERSSSSKKRSRRPTRQQTEDTAGGTGTSSGGGGAESGAERNSTKLRNRGSSEDNFSSGSTFEKNEGDFVMRDECETESYCSSIESNIQDEDRVLLRLSERLRQHLEYDYDMTVKQGKQHLLPARIPVVAILENFVKQSAVKLVFSSTQSETLRRRTTMQRTDKKEREFDKLLATVALLKEVADGLRIYFDFTITDYLLYKEEKEYALSLLSEENLKNFTYIASPGLSPDFLLTKYDADSTLAATTTAGTVDGSLETQLNTAMSSNLAAGLTTESCDEPQKRKLRSHRSDDCDVILENCLSSIASTSSGGSTPLHPNVPSSNFNYIKSLQPMALSIPPQTKEFLQKVLSWHILPTNAAPAPSMIFGAPHLARLIVKLPDFLNASAINDEKLKVLMQHLDTFTNYLESRKEWFTEENYFKTTTTKTDDEEVKKETPSEILEPTETPVERTMPDGSTTLGIKC